MSLLDKILRAGEGRQIRQLEKIAQEVNSFESKISALSDEDLRSQTEKFRNELSLYGINRAEKFNWSSTANEIWKHLDYIYTSSNQSRNKNHL